MVSIPKSDCAYWQDLERPEKILKLLDSGFLGDCKFVVGPDDATAETIIGHKVMFVLESPVLERMLTGDFTEAGKNQEIRIKDVQPHDFKNFRYMVYNNDPSKLTKFTFEEIMELYRICDKYMVLSISRDCIKFLKSSLKDQNLDRLITLFEFACGLEDKSLQAAIEKVFFSSFLIFKEVLPHKEVMIDKLNELPAQIFYEYILFISKLPIAPKPIVIFEAINTYFKRNRLLKNEDNDNKIKEKTTDQVDNGIMNVNDIKRMLFNLVKFNEMTVKEFIAGPGKSDLLEAQRKYDMLAFLCTKDLKGTCK